MDAKLKSLGIEPDNTSTRETPSLQQVTAAVQRHSVVKPTGETTTVAGHAVEKFLVTNADSGALEEEIWVSKTIGKELSYDKLMPLMGETDQLYYLKQTGGWLLKRSAALSGKERYITEPVRVEQIVLPQSEFQPPAGFRQGTPGFLGPR